MKPTNQARLKAVAILLIILLLHGEDFSSDVSASQAQYRLPAGECQIVLTSQKSPGVLKVYIRLP